MIASNSLQLKLTVHVVAALVEYQPDLRWKLIFLHAQLPVFYIEENTKCEYRQNKYFTFHKAYHT